MQGFDEDSLADLTHQLQIQPRFGARSRALVVDTHATARSMLASQLRGLGVAQVLHSATAHDARQHLANLGVDVLLVEYQLDNAIQGQTLIDELRRDGLLPLRTVVVMLSTQASYQVVAQVAESALDGFIIKPYTAGKLEDRLIAAFQRKDALREVYDAIENDDHAQALALCDKRYQQRGPYWTHAARLGAELALRLEQLRISGTNPDYVLRGLLRCGLCREAMCPGSTTKNGKVYRFYRCSKRDKHGKEACRARRRPGRCRGVHHPQPARRRAEVRRRLRRDGPHPRRAGRPGRRHRGLQAGGGDHAVLGGAGAEVRHPGLVRRRA